MSVNLEKLRKEAYQTWGLKGQRVIFDFPESNNSSTMEFKFRIDYSPDKASWPRMYTIAYANREPSLRIIMPIVIIRNHGKLKIEIKAWFDMSSKLHEEIVKFTENGNLKRKLPLWKKAANCFLRKKYFNDLLPIEDYVFSIIQYNQDYLLRLI